MMAMARERACARGLELESFTGEASAFSGTNFDLAIAVGASSLFPDQAPGAEGRLRGLARRVRSGGYIPFGEGYWKEPPATWYLSALGALELDYHFHPGNVAAGEAAGLVPYHARTSSEAEWDEYEWRTIYLTGGRRFLGFGLYLFRKP